MKVLRIARRRCAFAIALADLTGKWPLAEIIEALSKFAEISISATVSHLLHHGQQTGEIELSDPSLPSHDSGFIVLGMGKLGAKELNYSSDVDLILLFDNEKSQYTGKRTAQEFFVRLARDLVKILEERTTDGYVFPRSVLSAQLTVRRPAGRTAVGVRSAAGGRRRGSKEDVYIYIYIYVYTRVYIRNMRVYIIKIFVYPI